MANPDDSSFFSSHARHAVAMEIVRLFRKEYGLTEDEERLNRLINDLQDLYDGKWPSHEACQVGYHTIDHILEVALATARMTIGWNRAKTAEEKIPARIVLRGLAAAFFHDSGYLKDKNDNEGTGGKYTFSHVQRSRDLARGYLAQNGWEPAGIDFIGAVIETTEFNREPDLSVFRDNNEKTMAAMVASADLIAQMADINYIPRLRDLHEEFLEAYASEDRENLENRAVHIFTSPREILDNTPEFYEKFVTPRLTSLGGMDRYLAAFFGDDRNPYLENIIANISGQLLTHRVQWQRLGDILLQLGLVRQEAIDAALARQRRDLATHQIRSADPGDELSLQLLAWFTSPARGKTRLGDILLEMQALDATTLRTGLLSQLLPDQLTTRLSAAELLHLLRISLLAQNLHDAPWVFGQILDITRELLSCQSGSLLLINKDKTELLLALHSGTGGKRPTGKTVPIDKGLPGWVFRHARAAHVSGLSSKIDQDDTGRTAEDNTSILAVPLHLDGGIIGVVEMMNRTTGDFHDHDGDLLTLVSNIMASALTLVKKLNLHPTP